MKKFILLLFCFLFFFTPLILYPKTSEIFEFNKMLFVYAITTIILTSWLAKSFIEKKFILTRTPLDLPILLFLASQTLSTIFSIDPHTSIFGYYSRFHGGLASTICYIILFYALVSHISSKKEITYLIYSIIGSSFLVAFYGILERFGIDKDVWVQDVQNRVFSTLGQPNWLSAYLIAVLPLSLYLSFPKEKKGISPIYILISTVIFIAILFTKSQSGIATTFIVLVIFFFSNLILKKKKHLLFERKRELSSYKFLPFAFCLLIFFIGTPWTPNPNQIKDSLNRGGPLWPYAEKHFQKLGLTSQIKPIDESSLSPAEIEYLEAKRKGLRYGGSDSMEIRSVVWQGAIELVRRYPLLGTGVETFGYSYFWTRPENHNLLSEWDFLYNKAHNEYLNFAATTGIFGLITYLFLIFSILKLFIQSLSIPKSREVPNHTAEVPNLTNLNLSFPLFLGFISILITNYFGFSVVNIAIFFFLFPSILLTTTQKSHKQIVIPLNHFPLYLSLTALLLINLYFLNSIRLFWLSDINYNLGKNYLAANAIKPAIDNLTIAHSQNPNEPVITVTLAEAEAQAAVAIHQELNKLDSTEFEKYKTAATDSQKFYLVNYHKHINLALSQNPYHTNFYKSKAKSEIILSTIDPKYLEQAADTMLYLANLTPTDAKTFYNIGIIKLNLKDLDSAKIYLEKAIQLKPDYDTAKETLETINSYPTKG